jgi:hypothetical protein
MAPQSDRDELLASWRALAASESGREGWKTIPLAGAGPGRVRAGRKFPGNEEALLVGFRAVPLPANRDLPHGNGFFVSRVEINGELETQWLALARRQDGSLDMFTTMVLDVIDSLRSSAVSREERILHLFLNRISAWQQFMRRGRDLVLPPHLEMALFGELVVLKSLIETGLSSLISVEGWVGPVHGTQDFYLGAAAIEVKTTIATSGFPAIIDSLEQLDDSMRQPLFVAAVRLQLDSPEAAVTLPEIVTFTRALIDNDADRHMFDTKLVHAGYLDAVADHYKRRFATTDIRLLGVTESFPRLVHGSVPTGVMAARYQLDLDLIEGQRISITDALKSIGVI